MTIAVSLLALVTVALIVVTVLWRSRIDAIRDAADEREHELRMLVDALEQQHAIDVSILNGLSEAVVAVDRHRHIVLANRRFAELFDGSDPIGKPLHDVIRIAAVFDAFDRALGGADTVERFTARSTAAERTIEMRALPLASGDIAAVAIFIDVSRLERLEQIRRSFISDFSHEVRTPLAGLRSAVETFDHAEHLSEAEAEQLRRIMARQLRRLERLVDDLSELSRIESGELQMSHESVDLRKLVDDLCEDFADRAAHHHIRLVVTGVGVIANADPLRVQQALSNLIDNAMKYGGDGNPIEIAIASRGVVAEVRVTDHGEGIPEAERERVFRRFYRVDKSRSQESGGSGLGLAIAKHIVLRHGGSIDVESELGKGSTFIVRLPAGMPSG